MNNNLFDFNSGTSTSVAFKMLDAEVVLYPSFFSGLEADLLFNQLKREIIWEQEDISMYGKTLKVPRLTAWYGDLNKVYTYSGITANSRPWTRSLLVIKQKIEKNFSVDFNSVLLNLYRSENDSVSWHSDDEAELGKMPTIGSVSFGQSRPFQMKHKANKNEKLKIMLKHGDFLLMKGCTQHHWLHQVPKSKRAMKERINLTFRDIL